jgi:hypothetical protein
MSNRLGRNPFEKKPAVRPESKPVRPPEPEVVEFSELVQHYAVELPARLVVFAVKLAGFAASFSRR